MEKIRLQVFNQPTINGRVYVAKTKEDIEKLFPIETYLTSGFDEAIQGNGISISNIDEDFKRHTTIPISSIIDVFKEIEVIETGTIGVDNLPVFEVHGHINFLNRPDKDFFKTCFEENTVTIGMRSLGKVDPEVEPRFKNVWTIPSNDDSITLVEHIYKKIKENNCIDNDTILIQPINWKIGNLTDVKGD